MSKPEKVAVVTVGGDFFAWAYRYRELRELRWEDEPRTCTSCKWRSHWNMPQKRGRATHPGPCADPGWHWASEEAEAEAVWAIAGVFPDATGSEPGPPPPPPPKHKLRLGNPDAGCAICGRAFAALWIVGGLWACPAHSLIPINYRKGPR
jgi:hypothetical protein